MINNFRYACFFLVALLLVGTPGVKGVQADMLVKGMLLGANEQLTDPRFHGAVVLLLQHDALGTAGLVVNRPSRLPLAKILPEGSRLVQQGKTLSYGGPVEPQSLLALVVIRNNPPEPGDEIADRLFVTGAEVLDEWSDFTEEVVDYQVFVGYTGWAAGQLDAEMQKGDWSVLPAEEPNALIADGAQLWQRLQKMLDKQD